MLQGHGCLGDHRYAHADTHHGLRLLVVIGKEADGRLKAGVVSGSLKYLHYRVGLRADYP
ncbi:hypothetical protein D3C73_1377530 [compost metagenome]